MDPVNTAKAIKETGKKTAAAQIHAELVTKGYSNDLQILIDDILDLDKLIDDTDNIDWCRWLIAGGISPNEFTATGMSS